ncbi:MAG: hypothetical protein A3A51_02955 [Candidatus Levybacteria bacterium RIFCSPLOWO2_01_FULL_39_10]|nr:MAG: hypothetical protein A3A51_02955 [Candidatus Levybacteria bacterium RIFCSPLOWO2_01_FULL_39_10]
MAKGITPDKTSSVSEIKPQRKKLKNINLSKNKKIIAVLGIGLTIIIALIFLIKGFFVAAIVNGEPVGRITIIKELEKQSGKATLENLITKKLILQEAKKRGISVTEAEIDSEIKKIEESLKSQNTTLDQALELQGMTRGQLVDEIKIQLSIQKIIGKDIKVSDKEIDDFISQNKDQFPEGTTEAQMKKEAKLSLEQQLIQEKTQAFIEELKKNAKIQYFVEY